jgi:hypothetical protein
VGGHVVGTHVHGPTDLARLARRTEQPRDHAVCDHTSRRDKSYERIDEEVETQHSRSLSHLSPFEGMVAL